MIKQNKPTKRKYYKVAVILAGAVLFSVLFLGWAVYDAKPPKIKPDPLPNHIVPYVDGQEAVQQVESFYQSYASANPKLAANKKITVEIFGSNNLEFYYKYYKHGFDPITCSVSLPVKVTTSLVSTGAVATVEALAEYPDNTQSTITVTVVLNNDGMEIDSVSCPGEKGNLPPKVT